LQDYGFLKREQLEKPNPDEVFFLPQRPYMVIGSLRDQLTFPKSSSADSRNDTHLKQLLESVDLGHILTRIDNDWNTVLPWEDVLSIGEQQRIAMARLFYHNPSVAILDECTSALDEKLQERFYHMCKEKGITFLSVGHRPELKDFHTMMLKWQDKGSWAQSNIQ